MMLICSQLSESSRGKNYKHALAWSAISRSGSSINTDAEKSCVTLSGTEAPDIISLAEALPALGVDNFSPLHIIAPGLSPLHKPKLAINIPATYYGARPKSLTKTKTKPVIDVL